MTILAVPPVISLIQSDLRLSGTGVGILSGLPMILFAIAALPGSLLIARFGAVPTLVTGLLIAGIASGLRGAARRRNCSGHADDPARPPADGGILAMGPTDLGGPPTLIAILIIALAPASKEVGQPRLRRAAAGGPTGATNSSGRAVSSLAASTASMSAATPSCPATLPPPGAPT